MTNTLLTGSGKTSLKPLILPDEFDIFEIPRRGYDFNLGDRRFLDLDRALGHANDEAARTGVRQIVRKDTPPDFVDVPYWLVQAVGS